MNLNFVDLSQHLSTVTIGSLLIIGALFGLINTIAGGGSILTLPALMMLGLEPHAANATNRVGGVLQTMSAAIGFWRRGTFKGERIGFLLFYALLGGILGPWVSLRLSQSSMALVIQICLAMIALFTIGAPRRLFQDPPPPPKGKVCQHIAAFVVSFYGGFLQAGIGLVSLYLLRFFCGFDLVRGTAVKALYLLTLTIPTLLMFMWYGQVRWLFGAVIALGSILGATLGVHLSLSESGHKIIRSALPVTALLMVISLIYR